MPTIGQKLDRDSQLVCERCGHMVIAKAGTFVRPCPACMNIRFEEAVPDALEMNEGPPEIGLTIQELAAHVSAVLRARSGLNRMQVDAIAEAVARAIEANNRRLQGDIETALEDLEK